MPDPHGQRPVLEGSRCFLCRATGVSYVLTLDTAGGAVWADSDLVRCGPRRRELPVREVVTVRFTAAITHDGEWFVARAFEVEVTSKGRSIDEALANLREALERCIEDDALPEDLELPIIATVQLSA